MSPFRLLAVGTILHFKRLSRSPLELLLSIISPITYAAVSLSIVNPDPKHGFGLVIGLSLVGLWGAVLGGSALALYAHRSEGTLQLIFAAPAPLPLVLLQYTVATVLYGGYSAGATVLFAYVGFGVQPRVSQAPAFLLGIVVMVMAAALLGALLAVITMLMRSPYGLINCIAYPVTVLAGLIVPLHFLPGWVGLIGDALPLKFAAQELKAAADGVGTTVRPLLLCLGVSMIYLALAWIGARRIARLAVRNGTLELS